MSEVENEMQSTGAVCLAFGNEVAYQTYPSRPNRFFLDPSTLRGRRPARCECSQDCACVPGLSVRAGFSGEVWESDVDAKGDKCSRSKGPRGRVRVGSRACVDQRLRSSQLARLGEGPSCGTILIQNASSVSPTAALFRLQAAQKPKPCGGEEAQLRGHKRRYATCPASCCIVSKFLFFGAAWGATKRRARKLASFSPPTLFFCFVLGLCRHVWPSAGDDVDAPPLGSTRRLAAKKKEALTRGRAAMNNEKQ